MAGLSGAKGNILISRHGAIGDVLACEPALRSFRSANPEARILFRTRCREAMRGCPHVDDIVLHSDGRPLAYMIDLNGAYEWRLNKPRQPSICEAAGVEYPGPSRYWLTPEAEASAAEVRASDPRPLVVVCGFAHWPCRRWDSGRWRDLVAAIHRAGFRTLEVCRPGESVGAGEAFCGSWWHAVGVISAAACWVGVDSGPMWASLGLGVPTVALFGPTTPDLVSDHPNLVPVRAERPENGCHHRGEFPKDRCMCGHHAHPGMLAIETDTVLAAVLKSARAA